MKASRLIEILQKQIRKVGDLEIGFEFDLDETIEDVYYSDKHPDKLIIETF